MECVTSISSVCSKVWHTDRWAFILQVNYPGMEVPYTRIVEYKHKPNQPEGVHEAPGTMIFKEYSVDEGDPYYPVPNPANQVGNDITAFRCRAGKCDARLVISVTLVRQ